MVEFPAPGDKARAELLASLKQSEEDVWAGKAIDYDSKNFKDRLISIYRRAKRQDDKLTP